jgi:hypothetical protein
MQAVGGVKEGRVSGRRWRAVGQRCSQRRGPSGLTRDTVSLREPWPLSSLCMPSLVRLSRGRLARCCCAMTREDAATARQETLSYPLLPASATAGKRWLRFQPPRHERAYCGERQRGSDKPFYVAHGLALLKEMRTWCGVREERCHKKERIFLYA